MKFAVELSIRRSGYREDKRTVIVDECDGRTAAKAAQIEYGHPGKAIVRVHTTEECDQSLEAEIGPIPVWDAENYTPPKPVLEGDRVIPPEVAAFDANWGTGEATEREALAIDPNMFSRERDVMRPPKRKPGRPKKVRPAEVVA